MKELLLVATVAAVACALAGTPAEEQLLKDLPGIFEKSGAHYRVLWGLRDGGRPTSEFSSHLMNHEIKFRLSGGKVRVIYHAHPANLIAMAYVVPLTDRAFTRSLWNTMTECPVIFPEGIGVVKWMVPGGREVAVATSKLMEKYNFS